MSEGYVALSGVMDRVLLTRKFPQSAPIFNETFFLIPTDSSSSNMNHAHTYILFVLIAWNRL